MTKIGAAAGLVLILAGCSDIGDPLITMEERIPSDIQAVFNENCIGCHGNSGSLNLAAGVSYQNLVNVQASAYSGVRVLPSVPDSSVLWNKITGTSGFGQRMPVGGTLSQSDLDKVYNWIIDGAPPD